MNTYAIDKATQAKAGSRSLLSVTTKQKSSAITKMAQFIKDNSTLIINENLKDIENAKTKGLTPAMIDRLRITDKTINEMAAGLIEVSQMKDPIGEIINMWSRPNGMRVGRMRAPIGSILIIYESRPNVTADATALCLMAGNSVILRGGSEAINSNKAIVTLLKAAVIEEGINEGAVTFIDNPDREIVKDLLKLTNLIDLCIPRGGESLIRSVTENSLIPVLKHYKGVCHVYVDRDYDLDMAINVSFNSKVQRPGTCNAMETLLVDSEAAKGFLPEMIKKFENAGVKILGCKETTKIFPHIQPAQESDFYNEYLELKMNIKIVNNIDEAITHINKYSSAHTDTIVTNNYQRSLRFLNEVDSAAVIVNASTRLHDGGQFGLGAEIGISTDKLHARGTMGINELTCAKYIVLGNGQLRE
ncbi:MAG: glutamate-5-semialdehyde dehydrogenase [Nitrospirae bacterium]|nr:glutamate-5-semialdehyde dehydrogenase [Nitrospirota bacterium]